MLSEPKANSSRAAFDSYSYITRVNSPRSTTTDVEKAEEEN